MTLAGLILEQLERIPLVGEVLIVNGWRLDVMEVDNNRIERVLARRLLDTAQAMDDARAAGPEVAGPEAPGPRATPFRRGLARS